MHNVSAALDEAARNMGVFFKEKDYQLRIKSAKNAEIPDFSWADIMVIGTNEEPLDFAKGEFREINRALTGINFAGKAAGVFYASSIKAGSSSVLRMLADTDIAVFPEHFIVDRQSSGDINAVKAWILAVCSFYKETISRRK